MESEPVRPGLGASMALVKIRQFSGFGVESTGEVEGEPVEMSRMLLNRRGMEVCVARVKRVPPHGTRFA